MQSGGRLAPHMHNAGGITGRICVNELHESKVDSENVVFCSSDQERVLEAKKSQQRTIDVIAGSLCFFPSSLYYYTVPFEEKEGRIALAFDINQKVDSLNRQHPLTCKFFAFIVKSLFQSAFVRRPKNHAQGWVKNSV